MRLLPAAFNPARLFALRGGVHPETRKSLSADRAIEAMPLPNLLRIPLQQHVGAPAEPLVKRGDRVLKGQLIGRARGAVSAAVHAPTSGEVLAVGPFQAPHPSGLPVPTITLRPDGEDRWGPRLPRLRPETAAPGEIAARVAEAGIVGLGGAAFPSAVKLDQRGAPIRTLLINGAECEPYLTADDRLMRECAEEIVDGAAIMATALGAAEILVAVEANKPEAAEALRRHDLAMGLPVRVTVAPTRYPMGSAQHLALAVLGIETPAGARTASMGVVVHNVGTAWAVHLAVRYGEPLIARVVTVSGRAVGRPANVMTLVGTPVADLLDHCGGLVEAPDRLLSGGPMMGLPLASARMPVVKGTCGILAMTRAETRRDAVMPCIRCGSCVQACPSGLTPFEMSARIQAGDLEGASGVGLPDCISCGCCSWVCPSNIPLVQWFDHARGRLAEKESRRLKQEATKKLSAARTAREEAVAEAKRQAMAKRKAEMEEKKRREALAAAAGDGDGDGPAAEVAARPSAVDAAPSATPAPAAAGREHPAPATGLEAAE